jgi:hypothetical protein
MGGMSAEIGFIVPLRLRSPNAVPRAMGDKARKALLAISGEKKKHRKLAKERTMAEMLRTRTSPVELVPCVVELTRLSARKLDDDNLAAAFKSFRDGVADALGIDDGGAAVTWRYAELQTAPKDHRVMVRIARRP